MRSKPIKNYFLHIGCLAIDVVKLGGWPYIRVADQGSDYAAVFTLDLQPVDINSEDVSFYNYVYETLKQNHGLLLEKAKKLK